MRHVIAIKMVGSDHLEHIAELRWVESDGPNKPDKTGPVDSTREQMYSFLIGGGQGFAISRNDNRYAYLEPVNGQYVHYVKTLPDSTKTDNLLSLPRFN
jgi:uncharacterized protein DUF3892